MNSSNEKKWAEDLVGQQLGIYTLTKLLGTGGMAAVFGAIHTDNSHIEVAIKVLHPDSSDDNIRRFNREAEVIGGLNNEYIIKFHESGSEINEKIGKKIYFIVTDLVNRWGINLKSLIYTSDYILNTEMIIKFANQVGEALDYIHTQNPSILHRDIKPENILIYYIGKKPHSAILADFGIAYGDKNNQVTTIYQIVGTVPYMAPEVLTNQDNHTIQSDIYSFGLLLYEMITKRNPYNEEYDKNSNGLSTEVRNRIIAKKQNENVNHIRNLVPDFDKNMAESIMKAISKNKKDRYQSVREFMNSWTKEDHNQTTIYSAQSNQPTELYSAKSFSRKIKHWMNHYKLEIIGLLILLVFLIIWFRPNNDAILPPFSQTTTPNLGAADNLTPTIGDTAVAITPSITVSPSMVASTSTIDLGATYIEGRTAYERQDWPNAAAAFDKVLAIDPAYLDLSNIGSATYYNWAVNELTSPEKAIESLKLLNKTFGFLPDHQPGNNLAKVLNAYRNGQIAAEQQDWQAAINGYKEAQTAGSAEFGEIMGKLQLVKQLYEAYLGRGRELEEAGDTAEANAIYREAAALKEQDSSLDVAAANEGIAATAPTAVPATPTRPAAPVAAPAPQRLYFRKYAENAVDPTCFAVHVRGVNTSGWFVTVDGLGNRGNVDGAGNTNVCGLAASQEVTFTVYNAAGRKVSGGAGIPTRGGDLMTGYWQ